MRRSVRTAGFAAALLFGAATAASAQTPRLAGDTVTAGVSEGPPISPWGAFWRSLVIPGWGQAELGHHTRGAAYFVAEGASLWMWVRTQRRLDHARRHLDEDHPLVQARKGQREDWITLTIFLAFFNGADAWVSAHLEGFEAKPIVVPDEPAGFLIGWSVPLGRDR